MSEPSSHARKIIRVVPTVHRWRVRDSRLGGGESDAYAVVADGWVTLIDPLPVKEAELRRLGKIKGIVLTAANHQRAAWSLRKTFRVPVYAPDGPGISERPGDLLEEPDYRYSGGDSLSGGLVAFHTPGPCEPMYTLWRDRPRSVIFVSDLLTHDGSGIPRFVPSTYQDEPARTRLSVQRILDQLPVDVICFAHGPPICTDGRLALQRALEADAGSRWSAEASPP